MEYSFQYNTWAKQFTSELRMEGANRRDKWCLLSQLQFVPHQVLLYEANPSIIHHSVHCTYCTSY